MTSLVNLFKQLKTSHQEQSVGNNTASQVNDLNLLNHLHQVVFQIDEQGRWTFLNTAWEQLTGFSVEESLGMNYFQYIHPNDRASCTDKVISLLDKKQDFFSLRLRLLTMDEHLCWIDIRANTMLSKDNGSVSIIGSLSDVTNRVYEAGLYQASYRTLSTIIDNMCGLIYRGRNDHDWTMEYVSAGCEELTGYSADDMINRSVTFATLIHPDDREGVWSEVQSALANYTTFEMIYRIRTAGGKEKWVWEQGRGNFSDSDELLSIEGFITDISEWKRNYLQTIHNSLYVEETNLPRRRLFMDRLEYAWKRARHNNKYDYAVLLIHIEGFRKLKKRYDQETFSLICREFSDVLREIVGPLDSLSRMKEEEFGVLLDHVDTIDDVMRITRNCQSALNQPLMINNFSIFIRSSIGIALSCPEYLYSDDVIRDANAALSLARSLGGGRFEIFDETINAKISTQTRIQNELAAALENHELDFIYRPVVSVPGNQINALEVHLVWRHPRRGLLTADTFYPPVENSNIIPELNSVMLDLLCDRLTRLNEHYQGTAPLKIKIKLFAQTMLDKPFIEELQKRLLTASLADFNYSLIVPETTLIEAGDSAHNALETLDEKDFSICLDTTDVGIQLNTHLANLPINSIKLNIGCLKRGKEYEKLIRAQLDFLHNLDVNVTITNVDNMQDVELMRKLDCEHKQGEAIVRTLNCEEVLKLVSSKDNLTFIVPDHHAAE